MTERRSYAVTASVWLGALVVVGLPTIAGVAWSIQFVAVELLGTNPSWPLEVAAAVLAILLGVTAAGEATRVRLHGWQELQRGPPARRALRHVALGLPALALLALSLGIAVSAAFEAAGDATGLVLGVLVASGAITAFVVVRAVRAFREGRRDASATASAAERTVGRFRK